MKFFLSTAPLELSLYRFTVDVCVDSRTLRVAAPEPPGGDAGELIVVAHFHRDGAAGITLIVSN